ncbi:hypothetical protein D910_11687, partial [Dendroctonus ponderosae]
PDQLLPQGTIDFSEIINLTLDIPDLDPPNADDIAILPYSSGTTGLPKGVELTHRNIVSNLCQISTAETDALELAHGDFQEISPGILPMFHIYGFTITTMNLMTKGAKVLPLPKFTPDSFIDVLQNYHCSIIFAAPPLVLFLTHYPDVKPEYLHHLRNVMSGAAPLGALDESKFLEKANRDVFISQGYGLTETSPVVSTVLKSVREKLGKASSGSVGHVLPNTEVKLVKLDDKTATPLGLGEQGEVLVKGPQVMKGYHNNPEATKNALHEGWFKTGDLAYYDVNGMLFITDRVKELIKVRGYQVAPAELEELLRDHPGVEDAAVIGIPDAISGELPKAYVTRKNEVNAQEIYNFVANLVFNHFSKWDDALIAVECAVTGRKYTYKQIMDYSLALNKSLRKKLKLQSGDIVAVLLPNVPEMPIATLGILKAGLVVTTINPLYTPEEINNQLKDTSAKAIITLLDLFKLAKASLIGQNLPIITVKSLPDQATPEGAIDFIELVEGKVDIPDVQDILPSTLAFLPYSSGTTGLPKGVKLLHSNIVSSVCQIEDPHVKLTPTTTAAYQASIPAVIPMFHIYGFTLITLVQLVCGARVLTLPKFTPELYVKTLKTCKPHVLYLVPPLAIFLANHPSVSKEIFESVQSVVCGAAPLGGMDEEQLLKKAGKKMDIMQGYGMTETSAVILSTRRDFKNVMDCAGSIGRPVANTQVKVISIDDPEGKPLGPNESGELLVKGPQVTPGYHNRPKETEDAFLDGWLRTGDITYYDERALFYITDRLKELIKVKGFQVAPAELEEIIRNHPDVVEAGVIGVPHPTDGEVPRAVVVLKSGKDADLEAIKSFVDGKVAGFKQLKGGVVVADSIPKNASGKILRRELKLRFT